MRFTYIRLAVPISVNPSWSPQLNLLTQNASRTLLDIHVFLSFRTRHSLFGALIPTKSSIQSGSLSLHWPGPKCYCTGQHHNMYCGSMSQPQQCGCTGGPSDGVSVWV